MDKDDDEPDESENQLNYDQTTMPGKCVECFIYLIQITDATIHLVTVWKAGTVKDTATPQRTWPIFSWCTLYTVDLHFNQLWLNFVPTLI